MTSPLFRTLQIASCRYRAELPDSIIFNNTFATLEAEYFHSGFQCEINDSSFDLDLQTNNFSVEFLNNYEIEYNTEGLEYGMY